MRSHGLQAPVRAQEYEAKISSGKIFLPKVSTGQSSPKP